MKVEKVIGAAIIGVAASAFALDYVEVIDVKARQRYPWNGLVDVDFELDSRATEPYQMMVTVFDNVGKTNLNAKSVYTEKVSFAENPCMVTKDTSRIVWDAAADLPDGFKCTNVLVTCQDTRAAVDEKRYMVIDLSGGSSASSYPVSYRSAPPAGGWTEEYMTTKLVLRRIEPGSFFMGSDLNESGRSTNEDQHKVTLTQPYYIGIYEVTAAQYAKIYGGSGSDTQPVKKDWYTLRGIDVSVSLTYTDGTTSGGGDYKNCYSNGKPNDYTWPQTSNVAPDSFFGKLRSRTSLQFDLPTEAQWEHACRAGCNTALYTGGTDQTQVKGAAKTDPTGSHLIYVGQYMPNAYGLYDMLGSVSEWCLDVYKANLGSGVAVNPKGPTTMKTKVLVENTAGYYNGYKIFLDGYDRVIRGAVSRSAARTYGRVLNNQFSYHIYQSDRPASEYYTNPTSGWRIALTVADE